ncbi:MAG: beta-lactamase family protein [Hamadaea sp.]|uniref:serine hydrolase n=1 Tax=Hamadaea sp. TaxID=2024425 RepID=UPI00180E482E|nr:serine hydrolase domain-containing protein [Hamadaea sp.]NUR72819.1 beta-lactamase family protein [Hamadaea sp.]NUT20466.1 beta-lactamase family protein [Hamadaea sp.]
MPGNGFELRESLSGELGEALKDSVDFDRLAARLGRPHGERRVFEDVLGERPFRVEISDEPQTPSRTLHRLDVGGFGTDLATQLNGQCNGYALRLSEPDGTGLTMQSGKARNLAEGDVYWSSDVRMNVASVSKLITAIAARKALADAGVPPGTAIYPFLPLYWRRGPSVDDITFDMLLTHRSGFYNPVTDFALYGDLKGQIARGALLGVPLGNAAYQNVNFGLFRILIPVVTGAVKVSLTAPSGREDDHDQLWDALTIQGYHDYVQQHVFGPVQISGAATMSVPGNALAYRWPMPTTGWDSGDLSATSATTGWHVTANELVRLLHAYTYGQIVPRADARAMFESRWGVDRGKPTRAGRYFLKAGRWESGNKQLEQAVAGLLPGGLPFALLMNSQLGPDTTPLVDIVATTIEAHIVPIL